MGATERIVRHLRLRADSEASVRQAVLKLEDALRCASLPDAGARLLLVRRLDLGLLTAGASAQTLALLLEQRVAAVGGAWVHGADPNAERADFVFFRDALEARCELALQLAHAAPCAAWFWTLAVPEFKLAEGAQANLRRIALAIAALPEAPAALPAWIARLSAAGVAPVLAQAIGPMEAAALLRAARLSVDAPRSRTIQNGPSELTQFASGAEDADHTVGIYRRHIIRMASSELPQPTSNAQDGDSAELSQGREVAPAFLTLPLWVQTLAHAGGFVPRVVSKMRVAPAAPAAHAAPVAAPAGSIQTDKVQTFQEMETPLAAIATHTGARDVRGPPKFRQVKTSATPLPVQSDGITNEAAPEPALSGRALLGGAPSAYGGLLFLLPVMQRLGYTAWAEALPEGAAAQNVQHLLAFVLRRLDAPSEDPAWLFAGAPSNDDLGCIDVKAPASWGDPTLAAPRGTAAKDIVALAEQAQSAAALAHVWLIACRRWLRRAAGIGVASLVMRPAAFGLTATHADVFFRLSDADMRVRRAGLDFDPGWVPWLGRVVAFHYSDQFAPVPIPGASGVPDGG